MLNKSTIVLLLFSVFLFSNTASSVELTILTEDYAPYNYMEDGKVTGFTTEVVRAILKETNNEQLNIEMYPWQRAYRIAETQKNVLLYTMTRTHARENKFKWVGPVAERTIWMWKLRKRTDIVVHTLEDAKKYTITAVPQSAGTMYLKSQGFTEKQLNPMHKESLTVAKFIAGRDDLILKPKLAMAYELKKLNKNIELVEPLISLPNSGSYYLAFSLETPDSTITLFQNALDKIKSNGIFDQIYNKYMKE
ncbi:transporter substrate-binding domain-containing protein [Vibrio sp. S4M6]|uniref:substrate-binding periplasmic protein n=1 Tax=Vibrio sinus TaxID=2946865 RepID=UPI00202A827A|nr:transporter substrate-binding domain-containing protein [Vibrio sinus]MCL9782697.1 transporter substrate-binding domain-containing protein [Vibrio sinus]